jgi:hypothetical protein
MGPGRTGVKGVIRDRDEALAINRSKRAREVEELNRRMEKAGLGGKTFLEEERERELERVRVEGGAGGRVVPGRRSGGRGWWWLRVGIYLGGGGRGSSGILGRLAWRVSWLPSRRRRRVCGSWCICTSPYVYSVSFFLFLIFSI